MTTTTAKQSSPLRTVRPTGAPSFTSSYETTSTSASPLKTATTTSTSTDSSFTPNRPRINSRDITRSYSGLYGSGTDGTPFELARSQHTDWLEQGGILLAGLYLGGILVFCMVASVVLETLDCNHDGYSWTLTNGVHMVLTLVYLHWIKGSLFDEQGDLNMLTLWEQLEGRPHNSWRKRFLTVIPTLLCYAACQASNYQPLSLLLVNGSMWAVCVVAKLPMMNGVRIFGINSTTGIDDETNETATTTALTDDENSNQSSSNAATTSFHNKKNK